MVPINPLAAVTEVHHHIQDSGAGCHRGRSFRQGPIPKSLKANDTPLKNVIVAQIPSNPIEIESGPGIHDFKRVRRGRRRFEPSVDIKPSLMSSCPVHRRHKPVCPGVCAHQFQHGGDRLSGELLDVAADLVRRGNSLLAAAPMYHIYGFNMNVNINHVFGGAVIMVPQPTTANILGKRSTSTNPICSPPCPRCSSASIQHPDIGTSKIKSIRGRHLWVGAAALSRR